MAEAAAVPIRDRVAPRLLARPQGPMPCPTRWPAVSPSGAATWEGGISSSPASSSRPSPHWHVSLLCGGGSGHHRGRACPPAHRLSPHRSRLGETVTTRKSPGCTGLPPPPPPTRRLCRRLVPRPSLHQVRGKGSMAEAAAVPIRDRVAPRLLARPQGPMPCPTRWPAVSPSGAATWEGGISSSPASSSRPSPHRHVSFPCGGGSGDYRGRACPPAYHLSAHLSPHRSRLGETATTRKI